MYACYVRKKEARVRQGRRAFEASNTTLNKLAPSLKDIQLIYIAIFKQILLHCTYIPAHTCTCIHIGISVSSLLWLNQFLPVTVLGFILILLLVEGITGTLVTNLN